MDAKVLKAAVSAAIRVTVSTTLIGCGGQMSNDAGGAGQHSGSGATGSSSQDSATKSSSSEPSVGYPKSEPATGGKPASSAPTAGSATGGGATGGGATLGGMTSIGGMASSAGADSAAGAAGEGGTALDSCACIALLESVQTGEVLSETAKACCQTVITDYLKQPRTDECWTNFDWFSLPAHQQCCTANNAWQEPACTPWGPPVPPELSLEALLGLEAAA